MEQLNKADDGKPRISLVPMQIVRDVAVIREYGNNKYGSKEGWRTVEAGRYIDALGRHTLAFLENPLSVDEESGLPHLWHLECNAAFLSEMMKKELEAVVQAEIPEKKESTLHTATPEVLYDLYINKELSAKEIAEIYNCQEQAVYYQLRKNNIVRDPKILDPDAPKYRVEAFCNGVMANKVETDKLNVAGEFYNREMQKGNGVRLYVGGIRKSIAEAERVFYHYIERNKDISLKG